MGATGVKTAPHTLDRAGYREAIVVAHQPMSLNPLLTDGDQAVSDLGRLVFAPLLRLDGRAVPVVDLALAWGVSGDGLSYRFTLPPGRRWSDGTPLTADDVLATVALVHSRGFPDAQLAEVWAGVTAASSGGVVTLTLSAPRSSFPVTVANLPVLPSRRIAHRSVAEIEAGTHAPMPSSGPYAFGQVEPGVVVLTANRYAPVIPTLTTLEMHQVTSFSQALQFFQQGQVDGIEAVTPDQRSQVARLKHVHIHESLTFEFADLLFNERLPALRDVSVRRAVSTTINRQALITGPLANAARPQLSAIPAGIAWAQPDPPLKEDPTPALAARALDAAGWVMGDDGIRHNGPVRLEFILSVAGTAPLPAVANAIVRQMQAIGIACHVAQVPTDRFASQVITPGMFQLALVDWQTDGDPDVASFWRSNATPNQGFNVSGGSPDPFLDQALDSLAMLGDVQLRRAAAARVDSQLTDDAPAVLLYAPTVALVTNDAFASVPAPATGGRASRHDEITSWPLRAP